MLLEVPKPLPGPVRYPRVGRLVGYRIVTVLVGDAELVGQRVAVPRNDDLSDLDGLGVRLEGAPDLEDVDSCGDVEVGRLVGGRWTDGDVFGHMGDLYPDGVHPDEYAESGVRALLG